MASSSLCVVCYLRVDCCWFLDVCCSVCVICLCVVVCCSLFAGFSLVDAAR